MKNRKLMLISVFLFVLGQTYLEAQEAILASGGNAVGRGGSVCYSVGQVFYMINLGANGSVIQGVQQPYEISIVPGSADSSLINIVCSVYPNPVADYFTLNIENYNGNGLSYQLYNGNGQQIDGKTISANHAIISMSWLAPAIYFLKIMERNQEIKTLKIVKLKM